MKHELMPIFDRARALVALAFAFFLAVWLPSACAILEGPIDLAASKTAEVVAEYCDNFTLDQRSQFGAAVRERIAAGHAVSVTCPGDPPE